MSRLSFRNRLFIALLIVSAVPVVAVASFRWAVATQQPSIDFPTVIEPVIRSERSLYNELSRGSMTPAARKILEDHHKDVIILSYKSSITGFLASAWRKNQKWVIGGAAVAMVLLIIGVGAFMSRQYASPLNEIVDWTRRIQRHDPLPPPTAAKKGTMPELVTLQRSLYELQQGLEQARSAEIESERLRAFGEVARRVAHEMKNPLTPIRLAVRQLARRAPEDMQVELEVIGAESARLEAMARDFAELGRLPEGIASPVDLCELLEELLKNSVPEGMQRKFRTTEPAFTIEGYYDPLRRVFTNILRNAVEACNGQGKISIAVRRDAEGIEVIVSDNGPGIPADQREVIFQPYFSGKPDGTGLGLAIVRQTIEQHHGTITVGEAPGGGASFHVRFPG